MKQYPEDIYTVIEIPTRLFDKISVHLISGSTLDVKYLCANKRELYYLEDVLNIYISEVRDYFKLIRIKEKDMPKKSLLTEIEELEAELARKKAQLQHEKFPIKTTVYIHSDEDTMRDQGMTIGLENDSLDNFQRVAYELDLGIEVHEDGSAFLLSVNGVDLVEQVEI